MRSTGIMRTALLTGILALTILGAAAPTAAADVPPPQVPKEITAALRGPAIQEVVRASFEDSEAFGSAGAKVPDLSGTVTAGEAHQVYVFTDSFLDGQPSANPVRPLDEWIASVLNDGIPTATLRLWEPHGAVEVAGYNGDTALAAALDSITSLEVLVQDATMGSWYALAEGVLRPLNSSGQAEFSQAVDLDVAQSVIAARIAQVRAESANLEAPVGGGGGAARPSSLVAWVLAGALAAISLAGAAIVSARRTRQPGVRKAA